MSSLLALIAVAAVPGTASADPCAQPAYTAAGNNNNLNCNANDVRIARLVVLGKCTGNANILCANDTTCSSASAGTCDFTLADGCDFIGDTATVKVQAELLSGGQTRYDIGLYVSTDGGDALTGNTCYRGYLPPPLTTAACTTSNTTGIPPYCNADTDSCGDVSEKQGTVYYSLGYLPTDPIPAPTTFNLVCVDTNVDGTVDIGSVVTWSQTANEIICQSALNAVAGAPSKCRAERVPVVGLPVPKQTIKIIKNLPSGLGTFALQVDGTTYKTGGNGTTTEAVVVTGGVNHTVSELATDASYPLSSFDTTISCVETVGTCSGDATFRCTENATCVAMNKGTTCNENLNPFLTYPFRPLKSWIVPITWKNAIDSSSRT